MDESQTCSSSLVSYTFSGESDSESDDFQFGQTTQNDYFKLSFDDANSGEEDHSADDEPRPPPKLTEGLELSPAIAEHEPRLNPLENENAEGGQESSQRGSDEQIEQIMPEQTPAMKDEFLAQANTVQLDVEQNEICTPAPRAPAGTSACTLEDSSKSDEQNSEQIHPEAEHGAADGVACKQRGRQKYACSLGQLPKSLSVLLGDVRSYWTKATNMARQSSPVGFSTIDKNLERVLCYLGYLKSHLPEKLTIAGAFHDIEPMERYLDYLRDSRQLSPATMSLHLCAIMYVVKFLHQQHAPLYRDVALIRTLRNCSTALQKEAEGVRLVTKEDLLAAEKWLDWTDVIAAQAKQRLKFEMAVGAKKIREMANLVLISMYCKIPPSRGLEIRTLRVVCETDTPTPSTNWKRDYKNQNVIYLLADQSIEIHLQAHKTLKSFGADHLNLEAGKDLTRLIRDYVLHYRSRLAAQDAENFLLLNTQGGPFTSSTFSSRLKSIFHDLTGIRVSVNSLRTSFVTYCYDQDSCTDQLKDSLAASMRHSRKQAEETYDRRTKCQRKRLALEFAEGLADQTTNEESGEDSDCPASEEPSTSRETAQAPKRFKAGDFVAVLADGSSLSKPCFIVGRVQYYIDQNQVELLWYKRRGSNAYSLELDSQEWVEKESNLVQVQMKAKGGKYSHGQWVLACSARNVHKMLSGEQD